MATAANDDRKSADVLPVTDQDLAAYVGDRLGPERRTAVEGFLACNPDVAARVMTELYLRGRTEARPKARRKRRLVAAGAAACVLSAIVGWQVSQATVSDGWREEGGQGAPWYVEDALESQQATLARASMRSQTETPHFDPAEIRNILKLRPPSLPPGWQVVDAQVYPSDDGPGLNIVVRAPTGRLLNLFAVKANTALTTVRSTPVLARRGAEAVAYWELGGSAFVLSGVRGGAELLAEAKALARQS